MVLGVRICARLRVPDHRHVLFRKQKLLKFLPQCKCITSSSQTHLALWTKLLLKSMKQLQITSIEQSKVLTSKVARKKKKYNLFFPVPREICTPCMPPERLCLLDYILSEERIVSGDHPHFLPGSQFLLSI